MPDTFTTSVREAGLPDITLIADYWSNATPDYLIGMGVDLDKLPKREDLERMLRDQFLRPYDQKQAYATIWEMDGRPIGHCNVNGITFGQEANMHLHIWDAAHRQRGIGPRLVLESVRLFFDKLQLHTIWCEPYALNPAPNRTLDKAGFEFVKHYETIPGSINFRQEVNRWVITRKRFESL
jgi:[ribosomal protein S5]-alanine N-acetyltransferase